MKVLYLDHGAVSCFSYCDGVQLQCSTSDTHIQNCTISETEYFSVHYLAGVICGELGI